jgi:hypothetical protein
LVVVRAHLPNIHGAWQGERAGKASVPRLDATEVLLLLDLALTVDGESRR